MIHDRYQVEASIGAGGMGAVFRARHTGLDRPVAIKVLHPEVGRDPGISKRFDREATAASRLDHPNCVRVTDFGTLEGGGKYLVMEFLEGEELTDQLTGAWPAGRAVALIDQVLLGLEHAHHFGIVHRDLKPENIYLTRDFRGDEVVKLVDFGIAKLLDGEGMHEKLTRAGVVFGTPRYMSPEQASGGKIDERTDLYAVGLILYELLAGRPPFVADETAQLLRMQILAPPPPLPESVPPALAKIVERLLAKSKAERYASASEVRGDLAALGPDLLAGAGAVGGAAAVAGGAVVGGAVAGAAGAASAPGVAAAPGVTSPLPARDVVATGPLRTGGFATAGMSEQGSAGARWEPAGSGQGATGPLLPGSPEADASAAVTRPDMLMPPSGSATGRVAEPSASTRPDMQFRPGASNPGMTDPAALTRPDMFFRASGSGSGGQVDPAALTRPDMPIAARSSTPGAPMIDLHAAVTRPDMPRNPDAPTGAAAESSSKLVPRAGTGAVMVAGDLGAQPQAREKDRPFPAWLPWVFGGAVFMMLLVVILGVLAAEGPGEELGADEAGEELEQGSEDTEVSVFAGEGDLPLAEVGGEEGGGDAQEDPASSEFASPESEEDAKAREEAAKHEAKKRKKAHKKGHKKDDKKDDKKNDKKGG
ncbi:protein kinase [Pseudenhygromyxa sp. WMMC2535]|nr:serine/threonine-protein kinase [Pseudenhygromyxa sp. WMMC2535]NVB41998.1 protein kinase [Pseudenhygromyxa sp. WMMC2535]